MQCAAMSHAAHCDERCSAVYISANNRAAPQGTLFCIPNKTFPTTSQEPATPNTQPPKLHTTLAPDTEKYTPKEGAELKSC